jgi:hypothetical protein
LALIVEGISPSDIAISIFVLGGDFLRKSPLRCIGFGLQQKEKCVSATRSDARRADAGG